MKKKPITNLFNFVANKTYKITFFRFFFLITALTSFVFAGQYLILDLYIHYIMFIFVGIVLMIIYSMIQILRGAKYYIKNKDMPV